MKTRIVSLLVAAAVVLTQIPSAFAQTPTGNWSAVQAVGTDERLVIKQKDGKTISGRMIEANDANLTISRNGKVVNIARADIQQIEHSKGKAAKGKWAAIGAGVGAGAGAGIGASKYSPDRDDSEMWIPVGLMFGAGAGAITGLLFGASRRDRTLIYQAP
jgi:hypothetical protein